MGARSASVGRRQAARLATWPELDLVLVARRPEPLEGLRARIAAGAKAAISVARADRTHPDEIVALAPWAVIDAAGPFGQPDFQLARA
jgi:short-subunit dehydrogenase